ncbi:hypothetical protein A0128_04355 [Leptospira tipperaryensis]|uniref:Lcl C-terminal domain-containing protein n=1 Tax=Leptospira tipperaryensis TaxID=2564040 RepID=A0A1D7UUC2_9LEPT|nr:DUF1566 domain-containing protein [Leptospira tipperaryensis]AOP33151.1 hypothetical protein A0128_04355 [Leptospira tipperaryensis]
MFQIMIFVLIAFTQYFCVRPPEKPDPPYGMLQYISKLNSSNNGGSSNPSPIVCPGPAFVFNPGGIVDTGQTSCWNTVGTGVACLGTGLDGAFNNIPNARSFSVPTQHCVYPNDYTTLDQFHGLTWKSCPEGQSGPTCATGAPTQLTWTTATSAPAPAGSCGALNTQNGGNGYAGRTDWRLPTVKELASLLHYSNAPQIDIASFPNTFAGINYMTNSPDSGNVANIWTVSFSDVVGNKVIPTSKATALNIRCVAGNTTPAFAFVDNGNGSITDQNTGLIWQKCSNGLAPTTCAGVSVTNDLNGAIGACGALNGINFAGRNDWRLPSVNELQSIVDYSANSPSISASFPNTTIGLYWSSTTYSNLPSGGMIVWFLNGRVATQDKQSIIDIRCVAN